MNIVEGYEVLKYTSAHARLRPTTESRIFHTLRCFGQGRFKAIAVSSARSEKAGFISGFVSNIFYIWILTLLYLHCW